MTYCVWVEWQGWYGLLFQCDSTINIKTKQVDILKSRHDDHQLTSSCQDIVGK